MIESPLLHRQLFTALSSIASVALLFTVTGCEKKGGEQTAATAGDYVTGTPLPERREGTSFFGSYVQRGKFQPIYFDFDSQSIRSSETEKIQEIASFMKGAGSEIIIAGFTDERGRPNTIVASATGGPAGSAKASFHKASMAAAFKP